MNDSRHDALVSGLLRYKKEASAHGDDPFVLPFPGKSGIVPHQLAKKFADLDAAFGATISMSLRSEFAARIDFLSAALSLCESPIEARFLLSLICTCAIHQLTITILDEHDLQLYGCEGIHGDMVLNVRPQQTIGRNRVDFSLELTFTEPLHLAARIFGSEKPKYLQEDISIKLAVECDGHDFHEKTAEQAKRDKSRDRDLLNSGYPVMRFTGAEIHADPLSCSEQVVHDFFEINKIPED